MVRTTHKLSCVGNRMSSSRCPQRLYSGGSKLGQAMLMLQVPSHSGAEQCRGVQSSAQQCSAVLRLHGGAYGAGSAEQCRDS